MLGGKRRTANNRVLVGCRFDKTGRSHPTRGDVKAERIDANKRSYGGPRVSDIAAVRNSRDCDKPVAHKHMNSTQQS